MYSPKLVGITSRIILSHFFNLSKSLWKNSVNRESDIFGVMPLTMIESWLTSLITHYLQDDQTTDRPTGWLNKIYFVKQFTLLVGTLNSNSIFQTNLIKKLIERRYLQMLLRQWKTFQFIQIYLTYLPTTCINVINPWKGGLPQTYKTKDCKIWLMFFFSF